MHDYLLSIFPLQEHELYARVTCIPVAESSSEKPVSALVTKRALIDLISRTSLSQEIIRVIRQLDRGATVQMAISREDQRALAFAGKSAIPLNSTRAATKVHSFPKPEGNHG